MCPSPAALVSWGLIGEMDVDLKKQRPVNIVVWDLRRWHLPDSTDGRTAGFPVLLYLLECLKLIIYV